MKFLKKILILVLVFLVVGGVAIWGIWGRWGVTKFKVRSFDFFDIAQDKSSKFKVEEQKNEELKTPLKFAVMSDIHSDKNNLKKALTQAKKDNIKYLIITGDLTTLGIKSELIEIKKNLDESGVKYYAVPGNHDIWWGRKYKRDVWGEVFGESFGSFKINDLKFILVNNGDGEGGINKFKVQSSKFKVGGEEERQMEWLERETEECLRITCLVFMHMPLNHPTSMHVMGEGNPKVASEAGELVKLLVKNKVKEVFAGHLHYSSEYDLAGFHTTIVGAVTDERNFQSPKFLEVWPEGQSFKKREVFLNE